MEIIVNIIFLEGKMGTRRYIISDASKMLKVESHVLRYWEEELEIKIPRNEMGHRYYTEENIELLRKIRDLKEQGYGLRTIKMMINGEIDINRSNPNTVNIRNLFDKPKSEKNTFYKEDEEGCNNGVNNKEIMDTKTKDNSGDIEKYRGLENKTSLTESVSSESKMQQFQEIMGNIVSRALEENTESIVTRAINKSTQNMSKEVSDCVSEKVLKGVDYIIRMQDEREEERYRKIDEVIRKKQRKSRKERKMESRFNKDEKVMNKKAERARKKAEKVRVKSEKNREKSKKLAFSTLSK